MIEFLREMIPNPRFENALERFQKQKEVFGKFIQDLDQKYIY